jgi:lysophospholipase L1-like esterase
VSVRETRICVVGDELVAAVGDPRAAGWTGRVLANTKWDRPNMVFTLAVPGETSLDLAKRWQAETSARFAADPDVENRMVIALGRHDVGAGQSVARSRLNLANMLDVAASRGISTFIVGPPPGRREDGPALAELSSAYADVAERRRVRYVDTYTPLAAHENWLTDLAQTKTIYPGQEGYGLMAWLVLNAGWNAWLGLPDS